MQGPIQVKWQNRSKLHLPSSMSDIANHTSLCCLLIMAQCNSGGLINISTSRVILSFMYFGYLLSISSNYFLLHYSTESAGSAIRRSKVPTPALLGMHEVLGSIPVNMTFGQEDAGQ